MYIMSTLYASGNVTVGHLNSFPGRSGEMVTYAFIRQYRNYQAIFDLRARFGLPLSECK